MKSHLANPFLSTVFPRCVVLNLIRFSAPLLLSLPSHATDFFVGNAADDPFDNGDLVSETLDGGGLSLREAIGLANQNSGAPNSGEDDGDTIAFSPLFLVAPTITLDPLLGELLITDDVTIDGVVLAANSVIDGNSATRLIRVDTSAAPGESALVTLTRLNLSNGSAPNGGGIANDGGSIIISNSTLSGNIATGAAGIPGSGGAIFNGPGGKIKASDSTFSGNQANRAGGAIEDASGGTSGFDIILSDVDFTANNAGLAPATAAPGNGGAIHITGSGSASITGGTASGNTAAREGGAFWNDQGVTEISGTAITMNTASGPAGDDGGGGVFNNGGTLNLTNTTLTANLANGTSGSGGGIFSIAGAVTVTDSTLTANVANRAGGGIEIVAGSLDLNSCTLGGETVADGNIAGPSGSAAPGNGGGLHISGAATTFIGGGTVQFNQAALEGGGLWNQSGATMTITAGAVIADNVAAGSMADDGGGGIFNNGGSVSIDDGDGAVTITRNSATGASGTGGGILNFANGTLVIDGATLSENSAKRAGGGIEEASGNASAISLTDTLISNNSASANPGNGGGLHVTGAGGVSITGGTVSGNTAAAEGGGLWNGSGEMVVMGSTVSGNTASGAGPDQGGGGIYNLSGTVTVSDASVISGNISDGTAGSGGGILNDAGATLLVVSSTISGNRANRAGGGIEDNSGAGLGVTLTNATVTLNLAGVAPAVAAPGNGGGLHITGPGSISVTGGSFNGNLAALEGGGLWNGSGVMTLDGVSISQNEARGPDLHDGGGGVFNNGGSLIIKNGATLDANLATGGAGSGGGILNLTGGTVAVSNSTLSGNRANRAGGGIEDQSAIVGTALTLTAVTFTSNNAGVAPATASPGNGGAIHVSGTGGVAITGGMFDSNIAAAEGGGFWNGTGTSSVAWADFDANIASGTGPDQGGGALFNSGGDLTVVSCTLTGNVANGASGSGGGVLNDIGGVLKLTSSTVSGNIANRAGGGIEDNSGAGLGIILTNNVLTANKAGTSPATPAPGSGGALHITGPGSSQVTGGTVSGNLAASEGGGLWNGTGTMTVSGVGFSNNTARGALADQGGGALFNAGGTLVVKDGSTLSNNRAMGAAGSGGAILNDGSGTLTLTAISMTGNIANRAGGAIEVTGGTITTLDRCTVTGNTAGPSGSAAPGNGGAIHISGNGSVTSDFSRFSENFAANEGGGLWNSGAGTLIVRSSAIIANDAPDGGGVFNQAGAGTTELTNSTLTANTAVNGAGIQIEGGTASLLQVTLAGNNATGSGGGANVAGGSLGVTNTLVANNSAPAGPDVSGSVSTASFSLLRDAADSSGVVDGVSGNIVGADPLLTALADNGGLSLTLRPLSTSPVVNSGDNTAAAGLSNDQRGPGFPRISGGTVDMGAYEVATLSYASWAAANFTAATAVGLRGPGNDPDMDGISNALEYLTGMNPESPDANPFQIVKGTDTLGITFPRLKAVPNDLDSLETSTTLVDWMTVSMPARTSNSLSAGLESVTLTVPDGGVPKLFARLRITTP